MASFVKVRVYSRCQFHQSFFTHFFHTKVLFCQNVTRKKLLKRRSYEKCAQKMLMKLTTAVNFINVFCVRFSYERRFGSFFLVTFWQKSTFVQKKPHEKRWWNWHQVITIFNHEIKGDEEWEWKSDWSELSRSKLESLQKKSLKCETKKLLMPRISLQLFLPSISSTFYECLFQTKFWCQKISNPKTQLCNFWRQNFVQKTCA